MPMYGDRFIVTAYELFRWNRAMKRPISEVDVMGQGRHISKGHYRRELELMGLPYVPPVKWGPDGRPLP